MALSIKPYIENKETIHLIGIGGVSMNSLAELLLSKGAGHRLGPAGDRRYRARLKARGAKISYEHKAENVRALRSSSALPRYMTIIRRSSARMSWAYR